jgi:tetratricopeptide (TPR) repeat protein
MHPPRKPRKVREQTSRPPDRQRNSSGTVWILAILLLLSVLAVYSQVATFAFVNFDDPQYVLDNSQVSGGLTAQGVVWAFTASHAANWHPLTWISHMLDFELYGSRSGMHHVTSVLFHAASTLLLFFLLRQITGSIWGSFFVAFGFALHPLHVESVAWISERKDVLSGFFFFLTLWAYAAYARDPRPIRYLWMALLFVCALMSKQMAVTLPVVALILDFWPLRRPNRILEKIPLIALAVGAAIMAFVAQQKGGAVLTLGQVPLSLRLENAPVACVIYLLQFLWPANLAVFYPYRWLEWWQPIAASAVLIGITALAWVQRVRRPYVLAGWLWYVVTLLPVIGIIQIGGQAHADRYTYIPLVGILIATTWAAMDLPPNLAISFAAIVAIAWITLSWIQIGYWADSVVLFERAIEVTRDNSLAYNNLGEALSKREGKLPDAIAAFEQSVQIQPGYAKARVNLAGALAEEGRVGDAVREYQAALRLDPTLSAVHFNLANLLSRLPGRMADAIDEYRQAIRIQPDFTEAQNNLGNALQSAGDLPAAIDAFQGAVKSQPGYAEGHFNLATALAQVPGRMPEAIAEWRAAIRMSPQNYRAHYNLGVAMAQSGQTSEAISEFEAAYRIQPDPKLRQILDQLRSGR